MNKPITIVVCFLLSFVFTAGVLWPRYQSLKVVQRRTQEVRTRLQLRKEYWEKLRNVLEELKKYQEPLAIIDSALPDDLLLPDLFSWIESQAAQTGLILKKISAEEIIPVVPVEDIAEEDVPKLQEARVFLRVLGSYGSFKKFLSIVENSARLIKIENIFFDSFDLPKEEDLFLFDIKIKIHSY